MPSAKDIELKPITAAAANILVKRIHYSGKVVNNSQFHIGVFLNGRLEGAMQFGPSLDKRKLLGLVEGTQWHNFLELNRMAFSEALPRNSESRAISIAMKMLRKHAPQVKWVVSFADATQCGDGTIYRASGFVLTGIKKNDQIWIAPDAAGSPSLTDNRSKNEQRRAQTLSRVTATKGRHIIHTVAARRGYSEYGGLNLRPGEAVHSASLRPGIGSIETAARTGGGSSMKAYIEAGFVPLEGYQLRYIYFLDPAWRARLTVPEIPFSEIEARGAGMYRGERTHAGEAKVETRPASSRETGGANPTRPLSETEEPVAVTAD